MTCRFEFI